MKKFFKTVIDISSNNFNTICISAGKVGSQIEIKVEDISKVIKIEFADVVK